MLRTFGFTVVASLAVALAACGGGGGDDDGADTPTGDDTATAPAGATEPAKSSTPRPTITTTPSRTYQGPKPAPGTGGLSGRVLWNGQAVAGTEVKLCQDVSLITGCKGEALGTTTNQQGIYVIADIPPGDYALVAHAVDRDTWVYITTGVLSARKYAVVADKGADVGDFNLVKFDLDLKTPTDNATVTEPAATLTWKAYDGATYYEVYLSPRSGSALFVSEEVKANSITTRTPLRNCTYSWSVEAYNAAGVEIAESEGYNHFSAVNQPTSCDVVSVSPQDDAVVAATNAQLAWEAHRDAAYYLLYVEQRPSGTDVQDATRVQGATYTISKTLDPGTYSWYVAAYDSAQKWIAASPHLEFVVP